MKTEEFNGTFEINNKGFDNDILFDAILVYGIGIYI